MIQIDSNSKASRERFTSKPWPVATTSLSAEPPQEDAAEADPAAETTMFFVSPPPAPWPRVLPGL
jgi:hypothetical protein